MRRSTKGWMDRLFAAMSEAHQDLRKVLTASLAPVECASLARDSSAVQANQAASEAAKYFTKLLDGSEG